mgnify:FL=1
MRKESTSSQNAPTFTCVVCGKEKELVAVGKCDHRRVCSYCVMKSRLHYNYKKCPICLEILDTIFICEFTDKTSYKDLMKKKEEFYEDEEFEKCNIYYTTIEGKEEALQLRGFNCPIRNCHSETFENITSLSEHLNKVHKRFYCQYCLKENKLFLSQMSIYNQNNLNDHIKYGEYDGGVLISPPHPSCPFDGTTFYNDEQLFLHMNSFHFICQLCKDKKNIIFYPELKNLLAHYKDNHYCCPFQECLADVYVVFTKEEELISHLITKHKVQNANERLNKLIFERKNEKKELQHETGEFNFTEYVKQLKQDSENYKNNTSNRFINLNEKYINEEGIEVIYRVVDNNNNYNNYGYDRNNKYRGNNNRVRGGKNNRRGGKNYYNNKYNNNYNNNDWKKNNSYYENKYNYKGESSLHNIEEEDHNAGYSNSGKNLYNVKDNNDNNNDNSNKNEQRYRKGKYNNKDGNKNKKNIDYSFLFSFYLNLIKEFITKKIKSEKIPEKQVRLPKETIYQIIIMIDKFDSYDKLLELTYLNNFGIDLDIHKSLKSAISANTPENENSFKSTLENLELKKLLIIYKYLLVCSKRVDNLFYRLDLEQIDEDLYEDFCEREKKEDDKILNKVERDRRNRAALLKAELNVGSKALPEDKKVTEVQTKKNKKEDKKENEAPVNKPKTKISMLLNNELPDNEESNNNNAKKGKGKKKKGKGQFVEFNIHDFDLDKDFPKLK